MLRVVNQSPVAWPAFVCVPLARATLFVLGSGASSTSQSLTLIWPKAVAAISGGTTCAWFGVGPAPIWRKYKVHTISFSQRVGHEKDRPAKAARMSVETSSRDKAFLGVLAMAVGGRGE